MSNAIVKIQPDYVALATLASQLAPAEQLPETLRGKPSDVQLVMIAGAELGVPPGASLRSINIIEGKPVLGAMLMVGIVLGCGLAEYFECIEEQFTTNRLKQRVPVSVTYETKRVRGLKAQSVTWSMEDAKRAGLSTKQNWTKYPLDMLHNRAASALARRVYPDRLAGVYDPDEFDMPFTGEARRADPQRIVVVEAVDAEVVSDERDVVEPSGWAADLAACENIEQLQLLAKTKLPAKDHPEHEAAKVAYRARKAELAAHTEAAA